MAAPGELPNLGALRLGASAPEADTGVGNPQVFQDGQTLGDGPNDLNYGRVEKWIPAVAQLNLDQPVALNKYDDMVNVLINYAKVELGEVPKYIFVIDGENTMGIPLQNNARLDEMFRNALRLEQKDYDIRELIENAGQPLPEWRQPKALFICVSKNGNNRPVGGRVAEWYHSAFNDRMREIVAKFCRMFQGPGRDPRAVAYQLHAHVPRCPDGATAPLLDYDGRARAARGSRPYPCQDIKTREEDDGRRQSVCFNYSHESRVTAPDDMYEHGYCEFDDILTGRLYESALRLLSKWNRDARANLNRRAERLGLTTASQQNHTNPFDYYSTVTWDVAKATIRPGEGAGDFAPPPTPFLLSRDKGMRYREMHQNGGHFGSMHVNWEWVLFAPRQQQCPEHYLQGYARRDWNTILGFLDQLNGEMNRNSSPTPSEVDNSLLPFSENGLAIVAYPTLLSQGMRPLPGGGQVRVYSAMYPYPLDAQGRPR